MVAGGWEPTAAAEAQHPLSRLDPYPFPRLINLLSGGAGALRASMSMVHQPASAGGSAS